MCSRARKHKTKNEYIKISIRIVQAVENKRIIKKEKKTKKTYAIVLHREPKAYNSGGQLCHICTLRAQHNGYMWTVLSVHIESVHWLNHYTRHIAVIRDPRFGAV